MTAIAYRLVTPGSDEDEWRSDADAANAAVAQRLALPVSDIESLRRRITVDPVVVRHDGARWRSRQVWSFRSESIAVRVYEMLQIDEALYDH
jgi:hypothetical protein